MREADSGAEPVTRDEPALPALSDPLTCIALGVVQHCARPAASATLIILRLHVRPERGTAQTADKRPTSSATAIFSTSAALTISGGDRMMLLPDTRIITSAS